MRVTGGLQNAAAVWITLLISSTHALSSDQLPSNGCGHAPNTRSKPGSSSGTFTMTNPVTGVARQGLLHLPERYSGDEPAPLILAFHGKGQTTSEMESQTQLSTVEFNRDAIVVYPQGVKNQWTGDPESPLVSEINDIKWVSDLLDHVQEHYCVDKRRVYAAGFSNGGGLTDLLACDEKLSTRIAAYAIASGAFYKDSALKEPLFSQCKPGRHPIPLMEFHGEKDPVIHYDGKTTPDGETYSLDEWIQGWKLRNFCTSDSENEKLVLYDGNVEKHTWTCSNVKNVLVHYYIHGFGHGWPSTMAQDDDDQRYGPTYFDATPLVMDFFMNHVLPLDVGPPAASVLSSASDSTSTVGPAKEEL